MKRTFIMLSAAALLTAGATTLAAQEKAPKPTAESFKAMDKNADGHVTKEEYLAGAAGHAAGAEKMFATLDKNKDGMLTADEYLGKTAPEKTKKKS